MKRLHLVGMGALMLAFAGQNILAGRAQSDAPRTAQRGTDAVSR